jgi:hypothetical protein
MLFGPAMNSYILRSTMHAFGVERSYFKTEDKAFSPLEMKIRLKSLV